MNTIKKKFIINIRKIVRILNMLFESGINIGRLSNISNISVVLKN